MGDWWRLIFHDFIFFEHPRYPYARYFDFLVLLSICGLQLLFYSCDILGLFHFSTLHIFLCFFVLSFLIDWLLATVIHCER